MFKLRHLSTLPSHTAPAAETTGMASGTPWLSQYMDMFVFNLAQHLNVTVDQLNAAYAGALSETVDQASHTGWESDPATGGCSESSCWKWAGISSGTGRRHTGWWQSLPAHMLGRVQILDSAATVLGLTPDQLQAELAAGKSITAVATEHSVDLQQVRYAMLATLKAQLATEAQNDPLLQAQLDTQYTAFSQQIDQFLNGLHGPDGRYGNIQPPFPGY